MYIQNKARLTLTIELILQNGLCDNHPSNMMGEPATKKEEGVFYLATNAHPPWAIPPRRYSRNMEI